MAELIGSVAAIVSLTDAFFKILKTLEHQSQISKSSDLKKLQLDLTLGHQKLQIWQTGWLKEQSKSRAFWGVEGSKNLELMLQELSQITQEIQQLSSILLSHGEKSAKLRWYSAVSRVKPGYAASLRRLESLASRFNLTVDAIWLYSETAFDSIHGVLTPKVQASIRDILLTTSIESRPGSLKLYKLCCDDSSDCILDLDMKPRSEKRSLLRESNASSHLIYQLFGQNGRGASGLRKVRIENLSNAHSPSQHIEVIDSTDSNFQIFKIGSNIEGCIAVEDERDQASNYLKVEKPFQTNIRPDSKERLSAVLREQGNVPNGHLSVRAKVELGFKIVEAGFFLLGTPWLSILSSHNLVRLKGKDLSPINFLMEVQTFGLVDLLMDDSEALSETKQLFDIGVLLMELALDGPSQRRDHKLGPEAVDHLSRLPLVEKAMGAQYCKATAFCLQSRQTHQEYHGLGKFEGKKLQEWSRYMSELLQAYYEQVLLRFEELRSIDADDND